LSGNTIANLTFSHPFTTWKEKKGISQATEQEILRRVLVDLFLASPRKQQQIAQSSKGKADGDSA
jgi:hypothetical protein